MKNFTYLIVSPYYREYLVIEIYFDNKLIAEINQENGKLEIELYKTDENLHIPVDNFCQAIEHAKKKLTEK